MTAEKVATVSCNMCHRDIAQKGATIPQVRAVARDQGWIVARQGGRDYCPVCLAKMAEQRAAMGMS